MANICIIGAGALGRFLAFILHNVSYENPDQRINVKLIAKSNFEDIHKKGITVIEHDKNGNILEYHAKIPVSLDYASIKGSDFVIIATKAYDTDNVIKKILPHMNGKECVVTFQNGLTPIDSMKKSGISHYGHGITSHGFSSISPTVTEHRGAGKTRLGGDEKVRELVEILNKASMPSFFSENIERDMWVKAIVNNSINTVTAINGIKNGDVLIEKYLYMAEKLCEEAVDCAVREGFNIGKEEMMIEIKEVASNTQDNISSMLQDINKGRKTEIDSITGYLIEKGVTHGLKMKYTRNIYAAVKKLVCVNNLSTR